jgi:DNA-binding GntR family transcriptional regulator
LVAALAGARMNKIDAETLRIVRGQLTRPGEAITAAALAAIAGLPAGALRRRLARLERLGYLRSRRVGPIRFFRLNTEA